MTDAVFSLARALHLGSAMMLFALPFFMFIVMRPVLAAGRSASTASFCQAMNTWFRVALAVEVVSGAVWFWLVTAQLDHLPAWRTLNMTDLGAVLWRTEFGWLWLLRGIIVVTLGVTFFFASRRNVFGSARPSVLDGLLVATSSGLLISLAWAGHVAAGLYRQPVHLFTDASHLLISAVWPIGLIPMAYFLWHIGRLDQALPSEREIESLQRFSQASLIAVVILLVTGTINGWLMVGSWHNLLGTWNGRLLLGKLMVVMVMIGMGAWNRFLLMPRIHDLPRVFRTLRRTVVVESCLGLLILGLVGRHR